jgi:beta-glucosidase
MFNKSAIFLNFMLLSAGMAQATVYWPWEKINTHDISFPSTFAFGTSNLAYEVEGNSTNNTWYANEMRTKPNGDLFTTERSGIACDSWNRYKEDIQLMKDSGLAIDCFSIAWDKVESTPGYFDEQVLQHYADKCDELNRNGIMPLVVFKDQRDPIWFAQRGGFEKEANIILFERYCLKVFEALKGKADTFMTFWSADAYAMQGYQQASLPPFKANMQLAATVLKNQLEAHVRVYNALKAADTEKRIKIGIAKHVHQVEPWHSKKAHPLRYKLESFACKTARHIMDDSIYNFFITGVFKIRVFKCGFGANVSHKNPRAPQSLDFVGINYHSHGYFNGFKHISNPHEIQTDAKNMTLYPEGLYFAIKEVTEKLHRPIYITQNGIATTNDSLRELHAQRTLYALSQAIKNGYDVRGYCYYTFLDGYTWGGYSTKYGIFSVDRISLERTLKPGAHYLLQVIEQHNTAHQ